MSSQDWFKGPTCGIGNCLSHFYHVIDGLTMCQHGHVIEDHFEYDDDYEQYISGTKRLNMIQVDKSGGFKNANVQIKDNVKNKKNARLYGEQAQMLYYKCLQILLCKLANIFIKNFKLEKVQDNFLITVKEIWSFCLSYIFYESKKNYPNEKNLFKNVKKKTVNTIDLISILYLSIIKIRCNSVYIIDIIKELKSNRIPYFNCINLIPDNLLQSLPVSYHLLLQPYKFPIDNCFYENINTNIVRINFINEKQFQTTSDFLLIPLHYYYPFMFKILIEHILFPDVDVIFCLIIKICEFLEIENLTFKVKSKKSIIKVCQFPEIKILGIFLNALKIYFLNVFNEFSFDPNVWMDFILEHEKNSCDNIQNPEFVDFVDWSEKKTEEYLKWAYDNIVPKKKKTVDKGNSNCIFNDDSTQTNNLFVMEKKLFSIFEINESHFTQSDSINTFDNVKLFDKLQLSLDDKAKSYNDIKMMEDKIIKIFSKSFDVTLKTLIKSKNNIENLLKKKFNTTKYSL